MMMMSHAYARTPRCNLCGRDITDKPSVSAFDPDNQRIVICDPCRKHGGFALYGDTYRVIDEAAYQWRYYYYHHLDGTPLAQPEGYTGGPSKAARRIIEDDMVLWIEPEPQNDCYDRMSN